MQINAAHCLANSSRSAHPLCMSTVTIALPGPLDAALFERMTAVGAGSKEEYLLGLIESHCAASELERVLIDSAREAFRAAGS